MIIFVGVSGAGKGTQSDLLASQLGYAHVSSGDIVRKYAAPIQRERMLAGKLLDDAEVIEMVASALREEKDANSVILDGFPRTVAQTEWLLGQSRSTNRFTVEAVINLIVPFEVVKERLAHRGRQDDSNEAIRARIHEHQQATEPVIAYFHTQQLRVFDIDGSRDPIDVHNDVLSHLEMAHISNGMNQ